MAPTQTEHFPSPLSIRRAQGAPGIPPSVGATAESTPVRQYMSPATPHATPILDLDVPKANVQYLPTKLHVMNSTLAAVIILAFSSVLFGLVVMTLIRSNWYRQAHTQKTRIRRIMNWKRLGRRLRKVAPREVSSTTEANNIAGSGDVPATGLNTKICLRRSQGALSVMYIACSENGDVNCSPGHVDANDSEKLDGKNMVEEIDIGSTDMSKLDEADTLRIASRSYYPKCWTRQRQRSDASDSSEKSAEVDEMDVSSSGGSSETSMTSLAEMESDGEEELNEEDDLEVVVFEVKRAQTQSVEIKRGVLVNWTSNLGHQGASSELDNNMMGGRSLQACVPSLMVTQPSLASLPTLYSSTSSISVDLDEFPIPPTVQIHST